MRRRPTLVPGSTRARAAVIAAHKGPPRSARRCATETLDSLQILFLESIVHMISMAFMSVARLPNRGISDVRGAHSSTSLRAR